MPRGSQPSTIPVVLPPVQDLSPRFPASPGRGRGRSFPELDHGVGGSDEYLEVLLASSLLDRVIRDNGAEGQPSGWPSRAIRTVACGSHPQGRNESEDPRSGLTAAGNRARGTRSRALLNGGESSFGCHFHPPPRPPERSRSGPRSVTLIGPEVRHGGRANPAMTPWGPRARRGGVLVGQGMAWGPDRQRGRDAAVMVRDGTLAGLSVEFRARPFEPRPALGDPCKGRGGGGEGVQGVQPSGREGPKR